MPIDLLLVRHGERHPVLEQSLPSLAGADGFIERQIVEDGIMRNDMADPQSLEKQGWGIVVTDDKNGDELLGAIADLRAVRTAQQGRDAKVYRVAAGMNAESAARWKRDVYWDSNVSREERPKYLLILGDLDGVSLEFQQMIAADTYTGRLAFNNLQGYTDYVKKVLQWEKEPSAQASSRAMFYTVRDGTPATATGARKLVSPLVDSCARIQKDATSHISDIVEIPHEYGSPDPIAAMLQRVSDPRPGLFFSVSHGLGPPRGGFDSSDERRALQGAMCFDNGKVLTGADLEGQPFLPGGVWFMLSCYGGATPAASAYQRWLKVLRQNNAYRDSADAVLEGLPRSGERPFVAAIPRAVLANPQGPLAVIAHADLAWSCAFDEMSSSQNHAERFEGLVAGTLQANRIGTAFHDLYRFFTEMNNELSTRYDSDTESKERDWIVERSRLWMVRNDLAGYMLLGDPAVRLPLAGTGSNVAVGKTEKPSTNEKARRFVVMGPASPKPAPRAAVDETTRERAVIAVLAGESAQNVATRMQLQADELTRWAAAYREAGLTALRQVR